MTVVNVVVARYSEDLTWLNKISEELAMVFLYNKGNHEGMPVGRKNCHIIDLPNIGRESHTYLYHIVHNYHKICSCPDSVTLFTQGNPQDHIMIKHFNLMINEAYDQGISNSGFICNGVVPYDFRIKSWEGQELHPASECYGDWFTKYIRPQFPAVGMQRWSYGAIFAVKHITIASRSLQYYKSLLQQLEDSGVNPEIGHFFERSWWYIFNL